MIDYDKEFLKWLDKVKDLCPRSADDVPENLKQEFQKLMYLSPFLLQDIFGKDPEAMSQLLYTCLSEKEFYDESGKPLTVKKVEKDRTFLSPVTGVTASVPLYAEDDRGRCFAIQHCDWRGPNVRTDAAIFDTLHYACRDKGLPEAEFPEVYLIHLTDYDLSRQGEPILRLDHSEDEMKDLTPEEWRLRGCDPNEPEPLMTKFHVILFNATIAAG